MRGSQPEPRPSVLLSLLVTGAVTGCVAEPDAAARHAPLAFAETLVTDTLWVAPAGGDGAPRVSLSLRGPDGSTRPLPWEGEAVGGVVFGGAVMVLDAGGGLHEVARDGTSRLVASHVPETPAVSPSGAHLVWAQVDGHLGSVWVRRDGERRQIATGLASAGAFRFTDDEAAVLFVGGRPGGVAGLFAARVDGAADARCLTNCGLRTGAPWGGRFVPPPGTAAELEIDGDVARWVAAGEARAVRWRPSP